MNKKRRETMTLEEAKAFLEKEYDYAKHCDGIKNPIAYALYQVWKQADSGWRKHK